MIKVIGKITFQDLPVGDEIRIKIGRRWILSEELKPEF